MKTILILALLFICVADSYSQNTTMAQQLADKMAQRMKDSLSLTATQRQSIYAINIGINMQKQDARNAFSNADSLRRHLQIIENTRDSMYLGIIGAGKYDLYMSKKTKLVRN